MLFVPHRGLEEQEQNAQRLQEQQESRRDQSVNFCDAITKPVSTHLSEPNLFFEFIDDFYTSFYIHRSTHGCHNKGGNSWNQTN